MKVVTTFHPSSSVLCSVKCKLSLDQDVEHLVVAKQNRLDVFSCRPEGLQHECDLEIWGRILSLKAIPVKDSTRSNLVVMMDHPTPELIFLSYAEPDGPRLVTTKHLSLHERSLRAAEYLNDIHIDPAGELAVASCYSGKVKLIVLRDGKYKYDFDVNLPELTILALAFLSSYNDMPSLCILHLDHRERIQLLSRDIHPEDMEKSPSLSTILTPTVISPTSFLQTEPPPILIPVPSATDDVDFLGGVILVGGREILLFNFASDHSQKKQAGKRRRLETKKKSTDPEEVQKAKKKEAERESRMREPAASVRWPWSEVTAWCMVDNDPKRYLFGDSYGRLAMLSLDTLNDIPFLLLPLGETSPATTLTYLTSQVVYLGSHMGDSQLLRIESTPVGGLDSPTLPIPPGVEAFPPSRVFFPTGKSKSITDELEGKKGCIIDNKGNYVTVLQSFKNLAPIADAVLVDSDGNGQPYIVTCSGGRNTGSLNVVRYGADFEELAVVDGISDVTNIWPIRNLFMDRMDSHLLVSTLHMTLLFRLDGNVNISRVENISNSFATDLPTLALGNITRRSPKNGVSSYADSMLVVQVTPKELILLEYDHSLAEYTKVGERWVPKELKQDNHTGTAREIVAAGVNPSQFVLGLSGAMLVLLNLNKNDKFEEKSHCNLLNDSFDNREISMVSCTPLDPSKFFSTLIAVAFWGSNCVEIFSIERTELKSLCKTQALPSLPRALLLHQFSRPSNEPSCSSDSAHLLVGLGDGNVVSFAFKDKTLGDSKFTSLGDGPVCMTTCEVDSKPAVFASGSRAAVFFWERNRLQSSPVMLKDVVAASRLNTESFPKCLVVANSTGLLIGKTKDMNRIHIRSVPLGPDNPRRIVYDTSHEVFGVACTRIVPTEVGDPESLRSCFRLMDASSFNCLSKVDCKPEEEITAVEIHSLVIGGASKSFFCVGAVTNKVDEVEPTDGRLLVFSPLESSILRSTDLHLSLVSWVHVQGCIYAITSTNGLIAAAVSHMVIIFSLEKSDQQYSESFTLQQLTVWSHNYLVKTLSTHGDKLFLGDAISSVSVLKLADGKLSMVARDYGPLWPICVQALNDTSIIGSNADLNIFTFSLQPSGTKTTFKCDSCYHLSELVTKFLPGTLAPHNIANNISLEPRQLFVTSSGRIGVIIDMGEELSLRMTALQRNMASVDEGAGGTSHTRFRAPKNQKGISDAETLSSGFLDGDFLEQFLTHLSSPMLDKVLEGQSVAEQLDMTPSEIREVLEALQSLH